MSRLSMIIRFLCTIVIVILLSSCAFADVAFLDSVSVKQSAGVWQILNFDPGSGITDGLIVGTISFEDNAGDAAISGVTYDGTAMTPAILLHSWTLGGRNGGMQIFYLLDADWDGVADATSDLIVTWSNTPQGGETVLGLSVWSGVDQTTPITDTNTNVLANNLGPITLSVTAGAGTMTYHVGNYGHGTGVTFTQDNGEAEMYDQLSNGASSAHTAGFKANHTTPSITASGAAGDRPIGIGGIVMGASGAAAVDSADVRHGLHGVGVLHSPFGTSKLSGPK